MYSFVFIFKSQTEHLFNLLSPKCNQSIVSFDGDLYILLEHLGCCKPNWMIVILPIPFDYFQQHHYNSLDFQYILGTLQLSKKHPQNLHRNLCLEPDLHHRHFVDKIQCQSVWGCFFVISLFRLVMTILLLYIRHRNFLQLQYRLLMKSAKNQWLSNF